MTMLTYIRSKLEPGALRCFKPLPEDHPAIGDSCLLCTQVFRAADATTLVPIGPGADREEREKCAAGGAYNAIAVLVHWSCATGSERAERAEEGSS
jgi:hypothetical protein